MTFPSAPLNSGLHNAQSGARNSTVISALLALSLFSGTASAEPPVTIHADYARFSQQDGTGLYEGNAEMEQGPRRLRADRIRLYTEDGELSRVEAEGSPLTLTEGDTLTARAGRLDYHVREQRITLRDNAHITHMDRTFEGARIEYDLATRQVEASGEEGSRVRLVIPGQKRNPQGTGDTGESNDDQ